MTRPNSQMEDVAVAVAHQNAMERGFKFLPHGSRLFPVAPGWESAVISRDKGVAVADTLLTLEKAVRDPESKVIFIPAGASLSDGDIEKVCQRNAIAKTLFKEVEKS